MNWITTGVIVLCIIIITVVVMIILPGHNCFYDYCDTSDEFKNFLDPAWNKLLKEECLDLQDNEKTKFIFKNNQVLVNPKRIPCLYKLLETIPNIRCVFLQQIPTRTRGAKRQGAKNIANYTIRCVLPIELSSSKKSGMWIDGSRKIYQDKTWIFYDDSRESSVFNTHGKKQTYLLVIDIDRPNHIPIGISEEKTSSYF